MDQQSESQDEATTPTTTVTKKSSQLQYGATPTAAAPNTNTTTTTTHINANMSSKGTAKNDINSESQQEQPDLPSTPPVEEQHQALHQDTDHDVSAMAATPTTADSAKQRPSKRFKVTAHGAATPRPMADLAPGIETPVLAEPSIIAQATSASAEMSFATAATPRTVAAYAETPRPLAAMPTPMRQPRTRHASASSDDLSCDDQGNPYHVQQSQSTPYPETPKTPLPQSISPRRRSSLGESSSMSDLSSHSSSAVLSGNSDSLRNLMSSPVPAAPYMSDVPPAPPSTPASKDARTWQMKSLQQQAASSIPSMPLVPVVTNRPIQNAKELERQHQLYGDGAVTPAPKPRPTKEYTQAQDEPTSQQQQQQQTAQAATPATTKSKHDGNPQSLLSDDFSEWAVGDRYELIRMLGRGSYGEVAQARDLHQLDQPDAFVAIKRITSPFDQEVDAVRLFREIYILRRLRGHECIIQLVDVVQPPTDDLDDFHDLYLVFEYVDTDLYKLIMSPQYLSTEHIQTFLYQMVAGLRFLHSASVIHRDLKPANILLNEDCSLKICDFGLARTVDPSTMMSSTAQDEKDEGKTPGKDTRSTPNFASIKQAPLTRQLTKHVVTRWYRAPELILIQPYTSAVDIWSLGCILAELLSMQEGSVPSYQDRSPLFPGGTCFPLSGEGGAVSSDERLDQLNIIFSVIGVPSTEDMESIGGKATDYIQTLGKIKQSKPLNKLFPAADPSALDLLDRMLQFNPKKRVTAEQTLQHPFLKSVRRDQMEREAPGAMERPEFLNASKIDLRMLKQKTFDEVIWYRDHQLRLKEQQKQEQTASQT